MLIFCVPLFYQIFLGAGMGLLVAFAIGAAFLAVFYTQTTDLYGRSEELWEGVFNLIAVCLITPMSLAILRADRSRNKWRIKLAKAFQGIHTSKEGVKAIVSGEAAHATSDSSSSHQEHTGSDGDASSTAEVKGEEIKAEEDKSKGVATPSEEAPQITHELTGGADVTDAEHWQHSGGLKGILQTFWIVVKKPFTGEAKGATAIFIIPFITTLREGLEGVVFIGGVSLGLPATSIPLPAIVGLFCGLLCGFTVFKAGSFSKVRIFLIASTCILLIIAAGMISRSVYYFTFYRYVQRVGDAAAESGSDAGSYDATNYVWHINCCNPEDKSSGGSGYSILNSLVGWNNTATVGTILSYIFYWLAIASYLIYSMIKEKRNRKKKMAGRVTI
jgi:high-affinity iron transporter